MISDLLSIDPRFLKLGEKQRIFAYHVGLLIAWAYQNGYELTFGDAFRDPRLAQLNAQQGIGIALTLHGQRLAVDFNLFKDGSYCTASEDHRPLGAYWKSLHPLNRWGGDFKDRDGKPKPDGNHYSMEHEGRK
jgi:hypothetical protein